MNEIFEKNLKMISKFETVPEGWDTVSVKDLCEIGRGRIISQGEIDRNKGIYPVYSSQTSNNGEMGKINTWDFDGEYITWTTDGANAGTVFYRNGKFNCTNVCGTLSAKDIKKTHMKFLSYHLGKVAKNYVSYIGNPKLMNNIMGEIALVVPPYKEQEKIAEVLASIDNVIETTKKLIDKYKKVKQGLMQDLFTRGVQPDGKLRPKYEEAPELYKESELGYIPKEWEIDILYNVRDESDRYSFTGGPFGSDLKSEHYVDKGVRIIQLQNIGDGVFLDDYKIYTTESKANELISCNIYPNEIIIAKMAEPLARACLIPDQDKRYLMASDGIRLKVNKSKYNNYYILNLINFNEFRKKAIEKGTGTTRLRIGLNELRNIKIKIPSLQEQNRIASILESIDNKIEAEKQYVAKLNLWKLGLMQDLLTGKVRVKIEGDGDE